MTPIPMTIAVRAANWIENKSKPVSYLPAHWMQRDTDPIDARSRKTTVRVPAGTPATSAPAAYVPPIRCLSSIRLGTAELVPVPDLAAESGPVSDLVHVPDLPDLAAKSGETPTQSMGVLVKLLVKLPCVSPIWCVSPIGLIRLGAAKLVPVPDFPDGIDLDLTMPQAGPARITKKEAAS